MKTEVYVLAIHNPISGKITVTARATRAEVCQLLLDNTGVEFWHGESRDKAAKAVKDNQLDVFEVLAGNHLMLGFEITKVPLEVTDPLVSKLRAEIKELKRKRKSRR